MESARNRLRRQLVSRPIKVPQAGASGCCHYTIVRPPPEEESCGRVKLPFDIFVGHLPNPDDAPEPERRKQFDLMLSQMKHWA